MTFAQLLYIILRYAVHAIAENKGTIEITGVLAFTAIVYNSPEVGVRWTLTEMYRWVRSSLFAFMSMNKPHPEAHPLPKSVSQETK